MPVFDLTPLTRAAASQRRTTVAGVEVRWQVLMAALFGGLAGLPLAGIGAALVGPAGMLAVPLFAVAAVWLFTARQASGLRLANWRAVAASAVYRDGRCKLAGQPFDPRMAYVSHTVAGAVPAPKQAVLVVEGEVWV